MKRRDTKPRIKLEPAGWYAYAGSGPKKARNLALVPAINFCNRLNAQRGKPERPTP